MPGSLVNEVCQTLGLTQESLGRLIGVSRRTAQRISAGRASLLPDQYTRLAAEVFPTDPDLAAKLASSANTTLVALRLEKASVKPANGIPPLALDAVLCAAADAGNSSPRVVKPVIRAAVLRARDLGLDLDGLAAALERDAGPGQES